jgi:alpha-L-fucosidase
MQRWREERFGTFVHRGSYSGLAGTWDGKTVATSGGMEWIQKRFKADTGTYAAPRLSALPSERRLRPGMGSIGETGRSKYIVFTTKHHDGFPLHDSKASDRSARPDQGRAMPAELTTEGHSQLLSVHLAMRQVEQQLLSSLSTADISRLRTLLEACLTGIGREYSGNASDEYTV